MFAYDSQLVALTQAPPQSVADVLQTMQTIDSTCIDGDGLKWFNWLYLEVTRAVENRINGGGFQDPAWLAELDVQFARLYFSALNGFLTSGDCPKCWKAMFSVRDNVRIARIQFALAGINAHINHDLCIAIVAACTATGAVPSHGTPQYSDYTAVNAPLDALIEMAKQTLHVRLLGDALPPVSHLEDTIAAWGTSAAREQAWNHGEVLWLLKNMPLIAASYLDGLDGLTGFAGKALLAPVP
ncbi:MAG TPA: DUF5995 family protein [Bryobacteraceae bacterium]|nr:DUF5995 family protein [Bryobacteraceae bacterium]